MRRRWLWGGVAAALLLAAPLALWAQQGATVNPIPGSVWTYLGPTFGADWVMPPQSQVPWAGNNAALAALVTAAPQVYRAGYYAPGDGGSMTYTHSVTPCSLNAGVGDNGWQVKAADGGCWLADFDAGIDPKVFGCKGDGATVDTVCMLSAAASATRTKLPLRIEALYKTAALDFTAGPITIAGTMKGGYRNGQQTDVPTCTVGFVPNATNIDGFVKLTGFSTVKNLCLNMKAPGINTTGRAITNETVCDASATCPLGASVVISDVFVDGPCIGIALSGSYTEVLNTFVGNLRGNNCGGLRIGAFTNSNRSIQPKVDNFVSFGVYGLAVADAADYGVWLQDVGGPMLTNNAIQTTDFGLVIKPGVDSIPGVGGSQNIQAINSSNNYWGDTVNLAGIMIDAIPGAVGLVNGRSTFVNDWVAGGAYGVVIQNTAGGGTKVGEITFTNLRSGNHQNCVYIPGANVFDISINVHCKNATFAGIAIPNGVPDFTSQGSTFFNEATFSPAVMPICYSLGPMQRAVITGNNLVSCTTPFSFSGTGVTLPSAAITANNIGVDDHAVTVASAATINLPVNPVINLTGSATVATISGNPTVHYTAVCTGGVTFDTASGNVRGSTSCTGTPTIMTYMAGFWWMK